jgi:hypothetical protein
MDLNMNIKNKRKTYDEIKSDVLNVYFTFCRDHGLVLKRPFEQILGAVDYNFEGVFILPVENAMLGIVKLVLSGGRYPDAEENIRKQIAEHIASCGLKNILNDLPSTERDEFLHDLQVLRFIDK